jgi:hypothetical protein
MTEWVKQNRQFIASNIHKAFVKMRDAALSIVEAIDSHPYLAEMGIIGYMLGGKAGMAIFVSANTAINGIIDNLRVLKGLVTGELSSGDIVNADGTLNKPGDILAKSKPEDKKFYKITYPAEDTPGAAGTVDTTTGAVSTKGRRPSRGGSDCPETPLINDNCIRVAQEKYRDFYAQWELNEMEHIKDMWLIKDKGMQEANERAKVYAEEAEKATQEHLERTTTMHQGAWQSIGDSFTKLVTGVIKGEAMHLDAVRLMDSHKEKNRLTKYLGEASSKVPLRYKYMLLHKIFGLTSKQISDIYGKSHRCVRTGILCGYRMVITGEKDLFKATEDEIQDARKAVAAMRSHCNEASRRYKAKKRL